MPLLNWLDKDEATKASAKSAYRLLEERPDLSYGDSDSGNLLIQGDNLEALKALLPFYAGKVKCIYIDPPYNTKSAFEHYDDNLEHSKWLSLIYPRLELLRELLSEDGSIWVNLDDNEAHYLKVVMDEIYGRSNFISNVVWEKKFSPQNDAKWLSDNHDHIFVYAKNKATWRPNLLARSEKQVLNMKNPDNDPRGIWISSDYTCAKSKDERPNLFYPIINPNTGEEIWPNSNRVWAYDKESTLKNIKDNNIYWGAKGTNKAPRIKKFPDKVRQGTVSKTVWRNDDVGNNQEAKKEINNLFGANSAFDTPKPERLIERVIHLASEKNDLILDSFLGSATTAAVAHKMNRRYIGIEIGEHAKTHCQPRLQKVVKGEQGGISKAVNWEGGGGFRFCQLGPTVFDEFGLLNSEIKFPTLAAHVWYIETTQPQKIEATSNKTSSPLIGIHNGIAYFLLYNGILGDRRPNGGNVLTRKVLEHLEELLTNVDPLFDGQRIVYGETSRLGEARLQQGNITFKQIPYDVKAL